ncbi:hypothetical protein F183_A39140 [Bryobacterales bacterium F-183]|nr:hypothetical protein F183_A39140 [Bryobacterales bacterium F-183]
MSYVQIQKELPVHAKAESILSCLQDPLFWTFLPTTYRNLDLAARPISLGQSVRPSMETYRLADVGQDSVTFRSSILALNYAVENTSADTSQIALTISIEDPCRCTEFLLDETDKTFLAIAELFEKYPHYAWLPALQIRADFAPTGASATVHSTFQLPFRPEQIEDALIGQPQLYNQWIDPDIQKGELKVDPNWPARNSTVTYRYPRDVWFIPPFGRHNVGTVQLTEWIPGKRVVLWDRTEPGGVSTHRTFDLEATDEANTLLRVTEKSEVGSWISRTFMARFLRQAIISEGAKSLCELAGVISKQNGGIAV